LKQFAKVRGVDAHRDHAGKRAVGVVETAAERHEGLAGNPAGDRRADEQLAGILSGMYLKISPTGHIQSQSGRIQTKVQNHFSLRVRDHGQPRKADEIVGVQDRPGRWRDGAAFFVIVLDQQQDKVDVIQHIRQMGFHAFAEIGLDLAGASHGIGVLLAHQVISGEPGQQDQAQPGHDDPDMHARTHSAYFLARLLPQPCTGHDASSISVVYAVACDSSNSLSK